MKFESLKNKKTLWLLLFVVTFILFVGFTLLVKYVDVKALGPIKDEVTQSVGLSKMNKSYIDSIKEKNFVLYEVTDWASILTIPVGFIFLIIGIVELKRRKNIFKVDGNILALGLFYVAVFFTYLFFQFVVINYRPVLIDGNFEASYPSSTTVLAFAICVTAIDQVFIYVKNKNIRIALTSFAVLFLAFLVVGRLVSGVHWLSDIIGSLIISASLIFLYFYFKAILIGNNKKLSSK